MITPEFYEKVKAHQERMVAVKEANAAAYDERAELIKEAYNSGISVLDIKGLFGTTIPYLYKVIPNAFSVEIEQELVVKTYELRDKEVYYPK